MKAIGSWGEVFWGSVGVLAAAAALGWAVTAAGGTLGLATAIGLGLAALFFVLLALAGGSGLIGDIYAAGRAIPAGWNGLALFAQAVTGMLFLGLATTMARDVGLAATTILGASLGFLVMAVLVGPYLNKSGALTVPDFLGRRFGGVMPRFLAMLLVVVATVLVLAAAMALAGRYLSVALAPSLGEITPALGLVGLLALVLLATLTGGLRSLSLVQAASGVFILLAVLAPVIWIALDKGGGVAAGIRPVLTAGEGIGASPWTMATQGFTIAVGLAAFPALLQRFFATRTMREARESAGWALFYLLLFVGLVALLAGLAIDRDDPMATLDLFTLPGRLGLDPAFERAMHVAALAAFLSTTAGLALSIGTTVAQDLYLRAATETDAEGRATATRLATLIAAGFAAYLAISAPGQAAFYASFALPLLGAGLFPALVLAVWDSRSTGPGVAAAIVTGAGLAALYVGVSAFGPDLVWSNGDETLWFSVIPEASGVLAVPAALIVGLVVSRLTPEPDPAMLDFIEDMRLPRRPSRSTEI